MTALTWRPREPPLPYTAVAATGPAGARLATAVADRIAGGAALRAASGQGWLVVLGAPEDLPWTDGATYLGWDAGVLLPTTRAVSPAVPLIRAALDTGATDLIVLLPDVVLVSPLPLRTADPSRLTP